MSEVYTHTPLEVAEGILSGKYTLTSVYVLVNQIADVTRELNEALAEVDHERKSHGAYARLCEETENQLEAAIERLIRERNEARKESDRLYTECGQLWDEYKKMCEVIRTIGARCVELDDSEAVSAILDITENILKKDKQ